MKRLALLLVGTFVLTACPGDKEPEPDTTSSAQIDTTPVNFDTLGANLPPVVPDTFTPPPEPKAPPRRQAAIPLAPPALMDAVSREQTFTQFCYQEFGQKSDPTLRGGVAMVVTVTSSGISDAKVADDTWTSAAGKAVNRCLDEKAKDAWRLGSGEVKPGKYVVNMTFAPA
jgi:hypothetical protein